MSDLISRQALCEYALNQKDKCVTPNDIMRFPSAKSEITEDDVKEYCRKRCLIVVTSDLYDEMTRRWASAQPETHDKRTETHACDLINREQAIDAVVSAMIDGADAELVEGVMELLPPAQPERKRGRWLPDNNCYYETRYICSECKLPFHVETVMMIPSWRFCPNCGARMVGESDKID